MYRYYCQLIAKFITFLHRFHCNFLVLTFGTLLTEPLQVFKAAYYFPKGWKTNFTYHQLNPKKIDAIAQPPILLLHGNYHNQSAWIPLAKVLHDLGKKPVFTLNLPHGEITFEDHVRINRKINDIKALYRSSIKIDLIGHSRGAEAAFEVGITDPESHKIIDRQDIGKIICLGSAVSEQQLLKAESAMIDVKYKLFEVTALYDALCREQSYLDANHQRTLACGHLELIYSTQAHMLIIELLA